MPDVLEQCKEKVRANPCVANVGLPSKAYWRRLMFNSFPELYIVSRSIIPTPDGTPNTSPESSQHVTPSTTFPVDRAHPVPKEQAT